MRVFCFVLMCLAQVGLVGAQYRSAEGIWFDNVSGLEIHDYEGPELLRFIRGTGLRQADRNPFPTRLGADTGPRIVFLSIRNPPAAAVVRMGTGNGLRAAIERVRNSLVKELRSGSWIRLDVVDTAAVTTIVTSGAENGLFGAAFHPDTNLALLPGELIGRPLLTGASLNAAKISEYMMADRGLQNPLRPEHMVNIIRFTTQSWFSDGQSSTSLSQNATVKKPGGPDQLLPAALSAGDYLMRHADYRGVLQVDYYPAQDSAPFDPQLSAQMSAIPVLYRLHAASQDPAFHRLAELGVAATRKAVETCSTIWQPAARGSCIVDWAVARPANAALAILALLNHQAGRPAAGFYPVIRSLATWLVSTQAASGQFDSVPITFPQGKRLEDQDRSHPGLAALALVRLFEFDQDTRWVSAAEKGVAHYLEQLDKNAASRIEPHPAMIKAIARLSVVSPQPKYLRHLEIAARIMLESQIKSEHDTTMIGSYRMQSGDFSTARVSLCLVAAYQVLAVQGRSKLAAQILEALRLAAHNVLSHQYSPASAMYLPQPERVIGSFRDSVRAHRILLTRNLENITFLLELHSLSDNGQQDLSRHGGA